MDQYDMQRQAVNQYRGLSTPASAPVEGPSQIRDCISCTEQILSELHGTIDQLEKRLDTVLTPTPPDVARSGSGTVAPAPSVSHVHGRLQILNDGFQHAISRLRTLGNRIEV